MYDEGTLDSRNSRGFDRTNRNEYGYGSIDGARSNRSSRDFYCGKLVGAEFMQEKYLESDVTELWGVNDVKETKATDGPIPSSARAHAENDED